MWTAPNICMVLQTPELNANLMPWYCFKDAQFSPLNIQAEKVHCWNVHGGEKGENWKTVHVDHSPDRSILELSTSQHPRALAVLPQHPADPVRLHHLKLHLHRGLLRGETHIRRVRPEIALLVVEVLLQCRPCGNANKYLPCFLFHCAGASTKKLIL